MTIKSKSLLKEKKTLRLDSSIRTLSIKCYDEQLPDGWQKTCERIAAAATSQYQVIGIRHDRDTVGDAFWKSAKEKPHYHIIVRMTGNNRSRVRQILNLLGVVYRPDKDESLWKNHGVETVRHFDRMTLYLLHETEDAVEDGKEPYGIEEFVSNLTTTEIQNVMDGYVRPSQAGRVDMSRLAELDAQAYQLGYERKDFDAWYDALSFAERAAAKMKTIRESFDRGLARSVAEHDEVTRLSIFIRGDNNHGKTYAALHALDGKKKLKVAGGKTGKFDKLSPTTQAIIVDDDTSPHLLTMADNYVCQAYRRGSNNPYWCGQYFVVTSNKGFRKWVEDCKVTTQEYRGFVGYEDTEEYRAIRSRFYICHIEERGGKSVLICDAPSKRGTAKDQQTRKEMFVKFRNRFNEIIGAYTKENNTVDYSDVLEEAAESANSLFDGEEQA